MGEQRIAAIAQEVVAGWRQGRPVLDSLGDEQIVVADAFDALTEAIREIVDAGEALTRPGSQGQEHVNGVRMTNAVQAGAKLIGHTTGIFPELAS